ncbi:MAG: NAD(P)-dependent oxidoreductase [Actinomycetota bacterium]|nr:NAD(P)-dependent oxidoreductase [Actinomycetota bacterium]
MSSPERFLVTGAMGCIGSWVIRLLLEEGTEVVAFDLSDDRRRPRLLVSDGQLDEVAFLRGDITDTEGVSETIRQRRISHVIHLAALQVPFCRADPVGGARVNVVGTLNVFEAVRALDRPVGITYASSVAVFGPADGYPDGRVGDDSPTAPTTLYGAYKQANEWTARIYAQDYGIGSVGLRPAIVYGVGRDQGLTSGATKAMLAAAAGRPFHIPHGGRSVFQYAPDVARLFITAARSRPPGAEVLNVGGSHVDVAEVVAAIEKAVPDARITHEETPLSFPEGMDAAGAEGLLGPVTYTPLSEGVGETIEQFQRLLEQGVVAPEID